VAARSRQAWQWRLGFSWCMIVGIWLWIEGSFEGASARRTSGQFREEELMGSYIVAI
jgi:hypothetical protein